VKPEPPFIPGRAGVGAVAEDEPTLARELGAGAAINGVT
jgi:hypothetical protein